MIYKYAHPENFQSEQTVDLHKYDGNIVLWGAGKAGSVTAYCLETRGFKISAFVDINNLRWGNSYLKNTVISPEQLKEKHSKALVIITSIYYDSISEELENMGIANYISATQILMQVDFSPYPQWCDEKASDGYDTISTEFAVRVTEEYMAAMNRILNEFCTDQIYYLVTTRCTLRCRHCSLFVPYLKDFYDDNAQDIITDLNKLIKGFGKLRVVNFQGGEPFLHNGLGEIIRSLKSEPNIENIRIITNGTVLPNDDLLAALKDDPRLQIRISDYGKLSSHLAALTKLLEDNAVYYEVTNFPSWYETSKLGKTNETTEQVINKFKRCRRNCHVNVYRGKVFYCNIHAIMYELGEYPELIGGYIDLRENMTEDISKTLQAYSQRVAHGEYIELCRYCDIGTHMKYDKPIPPAEQTDERLIFPKVVPDNICR